jgi:hypothetical protein
MWSEDSGGVARLTPNLDVLIEVPLVVKLP